jgi:hypothetical protein
MNANVRGRRLPGGGLDMAGLVARLRRVGSFLEMGAPWQAGRELRALVGELEAGAGGLAGVPGQAVRTERRGAGGLVPAQGQAVRSAQGESGERAQGHRQAVRSARRSSKGRPKGTRASIAQCPRREGGARRRSLRAGRAHRL